VLRLLIIFMLIFSCITPVYAKQLLFNKRSVNGTTSFYYKWHDKYKKVQDLSFKLPTKTLRAAQSEFKPFDNRISNDYVYERLKEYTKNHNDLKSKIKVKRVRLGFELEAEGTSQELMQQAMTELQELSKSAMDDYVEDHYYKYMDGRTIRPDHARIAHKYVSLMRPVAEAISKKVNSKDPRDVVNYALSFVQAIPYDILKSRYFSNGAGFQVPYGLLMGNKGDCDTKSVALAAILRNFYPRLRMMMVYVPDHAFVGLAFPAKGGDRTIRLDGTSFLLAEPVGPNQSPLGVVAERSLEQLSVNEFTYEEIPF
jgi:hypothetical protein